VTTVTITSQGSGYTSAPAVSFTSSSGFGATAVAILGSGASADKVVSVEVTDGGTGYQTPPAISFTGVASAAAIATATIEVDIDQVDSYGDNNSFKDESKDIIFNEGNPFGEIE
jgi:hypothetical protein